MPLSARANTATAWVTVPVGLYFYVFHGDWFLLYTVDVQRIPSALALVGFVLLGGIGALGFAAGANMVRNQRDTLGGIIAGFGVLAAAATLLVARDRLVLVGTHAQWEGRFGLEPFESGPALQGALLGAAVLVLGHVFLLMRLSFGGRRA
jgi:hypothetical protein